jgi:hypothetical protein
MYNYVVQGNKSVVILYWQPNFNWLAANLKWSQKINSELYYKKAAKNKSTVDEAELAGQELFSLDKATALVLLMETILYEENMQLRQ